MKRHTLRNAFASLALIALTGPLAQAGSFFDPDELISFCFTDSNWSEAGGGPVGGEVTGTFSGFDTNSDDIISIFEISAFDATWSPTGASPIPATSWDDLDLIFGFGSVFAYDMVANTLELFVTNFDYTYQASSATGSDLVSFAGTLQSPDSLTIDSKQNTVPDSGSSIALLLVSLVGVGLVKRATPRSRS